MRVVLYLLPFLLAACGDTVVNQFVVGLDAAGNDAAPIDAADREGTAASGCVPDCRGFECGDDGCGGSCGECGAERHCIGIQVCAPLPDLDPCDGRPLDTTWCEGLARVQCRGSGYIDYDAVRCEPHYVCHYQAPCPDGDTCTCESQDACICVPGG